jgi:hypothetical protein
MHGFYNSAGDFATALGRLACRLAGVASPRHASSLLGAVLEQARSTEQGWEKGHLPVNAGKKMARAPSGESGVS